MPLADMAGRDGVDRRRHVAHRRAKGVEDGGVIGGRAHPLTMLGLELRRKREGSM